MFEVVLVCSLALCVLEAVVAEPFGYEEIGCVVEDFSGAFGGEGVGES